MVISKENSLGSLALTAYLPSNNPTMTTHMVGKNDPAIARNICTFGRVANYIERFGKESYTVYSPDPENEAHEHKLITDTITKQELKNAFLKDLCGSPIKCTDKNIQPNTSNWSGIDIATFNVHYKNLPGKVNADSWDFWFKLTSKIGTKSIAQVKKYARDQYHQQSIQGVPVAAVHDDVSDSNSSSSSSSTNSNDSNSNNNDAPDSTLANTAPIAATPKWTWKKVLQNKSLMKIIQNLMKNAKNEDYTVKQSYANGNMKKYEFNDILVR